MAKHRGYEVKKGLCGGFGAFIDGHQVNREETEELVIAAIDRWHASWRFTLTDPNARVEDKESCLGAILECGETVEN